MITTYTLPTKSDVEKYFTFVDGTKRLGIAFNDNKATDYWLRNEMKSQTGWYFSSYGECYNGQFGEKFGVRPMIIIKLSPVG